MDEPSVGADGWSFEGGMVDTPKVGGDKMGPVMGEMSGDATDGQRDWIRATPGARLCVLVGVPLGLMAW